MCIPYSSRSYKRSCILLSDDARVLVRLKLLYNDEVASTYGWVIANHEFLLVSLTQCAPFNRNNTFGKLTIICIDSKVKYHHAVKSFWYLLDINLRGTFIPTRFLKKTYKKFFKDKIKLLILEKRSFLFISFIDLFNVITKTLQKTNIRYKRNN